MRRDFSAIVFKIKDSTTEERAGANNDRGNYDEPLPTSPASTQISIAVSVAGASDDVKAGKRDFSVNTESNQQYPVSML